MKISIVMATWMGERFLEAQLQSFLDQTRLPDELVVRDDGSSDRTLAILHQFAERSPFPVHVLPVGPRLGYAANFGTTLMHACGELIFLSDQDDVWLPHRLETIEQIAANQPVKLLFINDIENVDASLNRTGVTKLGNLRRSGLPDRRYITGCATAIRRPLLDVALPLPEGLKAHDQWLHACAHWLGVRVVIPEILQLYRRHSDNASDAAISHPRQIKRLINNLETLNSDALNSHRQQLLIARELHERLINSPERASQLAEVNLSKALPILETRLQALQGRVAVLEASWPGRLPQALVFWITGGYRNFSGWKSLVKDLLNRVRLA